MKHLKILFISLFAFAASGFAQADTLLPLQSDTVHVYLTEEQHISIIAYLPDKGQAERSKYIFTMLPQIEIEKDSTGKNILKNPDKVIRYASPVSFMEDVFLIRGSKQERLVAADNRAIQTALYQQLQRRPDVLQRIGVIVARNAADNDEVIQVEGIDYLAKLKE